MNGLRAATAAWLNRLRKVESVWECTGVGLRQPLYAASQLSMNAQHPIVSQSNGRARIED